MKLVCFPGYTCGGLICDILNLQTSKIGPSNNIASNTHHLAKIHTENWHTGRGFDYKSFIERLEKYQKHKLYIGTHCWPGDLDTELFESIINITTENRLSKIFRYTRVFYTYVNGQFPDYINKNDRTLKPQLPKDPIIDFNQSFLSVHKPNIINIEFEKIVLCDNDFQNIIYNIIGKEYQHHLENRMKVWKGVNDFLFDERFDLILKMWEESKL